MKTAQDKLKHQAKRPLLTAMQTANMHYLLNERMTQAQVERMLERRHENCAHI